jgi:hypothetical protein
LLRWSMREPAITSDLTGNGRERQIMKRFASGE